MLDGVQEVAVKIFFDVHNAREEADILREVAILKGCRDRNVVQFYGACHEVRVPSQATTVSEKSGISDRHGPHRALWATIAYMSRHTLHTKCFAEAAAAARYPVPRACHEGLLICVALIAMAA